jgi:hypothetical protein
MRETRAESTVYPPAYNMQVVRSLTTDGWFLPGAPLIELNRLLPGSGRYDLGEWEVRCRRPDNIQPRLGWLRAYMGCAVQ